MSETFRLILRPAAISGLGGCYEALPAYLHKIGLIDTSRNAGGSNLYYAGSNFLSYINFLGCAPDIRFDAEGDDRNFIHVALQTTRDVQFLSNQFSRKPRCPECRKLLDSWESGLETWNRDNTRDAIACKDCGSPLKIYDLDWKRSAGFAAEHVQVRGIYPGEAIPADSLLSRLSELTGGKWLYFYA